ncbi:DUF4044 domain-containing protein [Paenibacillus thermoaerophilus]|uniref:DUF4044 domain-containing protein n=1 Tax=Paenibacillus thermoaerophilus TaxID=1215385 RepID=A0ABW2V3G0_9BACL|nr:DUF4044 domain-containing protein [Paenibacillus thermoaerophilus]TMV12001.1 DUF4044 domain-containing protein [Paenibacillus thermoaerophilus]
MIPKRLVKFVVWLMLLSMLSSVVLFAVNVLST